jgi:hypothetical protein
MYDTCLTEINQQKYSEHTKALHTPQTFSNYFVTTRRVVFSLSVVCDSLKT